MDQPIQTSNAGRPILHTRWVRISHWLITLGFLTLAYTGVMILMVHPRLYWGEVGNDLTKPIVELPISRNYQHNGWQSKGVVFLDNAGLISSNRTYDIFNQNGWGRSLHFLAGWVLVTTGLPYLLFGIISGHFRRNLLPSRAQISQSSIRLEIQNHLRFRIPRANGGPAYGFLQKSTYVGVIFIGLPMMFITGIAMAPAVTAAFPFLLDVFGGYQSARTIHFLSFIVLVVFLIMHIVMIIASGFRAQMRGMTLGVKHEE
ncbi:MAG: cytochrome b/b6 domain-containing protein [Acidobacteriota bacterium]